MSRQDQAYTFPTGLRPHVKVFPRIGGFPNVLGFDHELNDVRVFLRDPGDVLRVTSSPAAAQRNVVVLVEVMHVREDAPINSRVRSIRLNLG